MLFKILDSYGFLDNCLKKLLTTLTSFPSLDAKRNEDNLFKRKLAYPNEKGQTLKSFHVEKRKIGWEE